MRKNDCMKKEGIISKTSVITMIVSVGILLAGCDFSESDSLMGQGFDAIHRGDYQSAQTLFLNAASEEGQSKELYRAMGIASLGAGNYEEALENFENALSMSNGIIEDIDIDISYYKAVAEYRNGDTDKAIQTYDAIIAIDPKEDNAYYMRGKAYLADGDKQKAIENFDQAIMLRPSDYNHYLRICQDLSDAGYESDGKSYIQKALNDNPKLSEYQLGIFNYYLGNYTDARNNLENSKNSGDAGSDRVLYLGKTYEALGDADYALTLYENYIADGNPAAVAYLNIGLIKMRQQNYQGALDAFEAGVQLNDMAYMQPLMYNRIVAYEYLRDFASAKGLMSEYIERYPGDEKAARENIFLSTR